MVSPNPTITCLVCGGPMELNPQALEAARKGLVFTAAAMPSVRAIPDSLEWIDADIRNEYGNVEPYRALNALTRLFNGCTECGRAPLRTRPTEWETKGSYSQGERSGKRQAFQQVSAMLRNMQRRISNLEGQ